MKLWVQYPQAAADVKVRLIKRKAPFSPQPLPTTPLAASFRLRRTGKRGEEFTPPAFS